jgi:hypothetical protein
LRKKINLYLRHSIGFAWQQRNNNRNKGRRRFFSKKNREIEKMQETGKKAGKREIFQKNLYKIFQKNLYIS